MLVSDVGQKVYETKALFISQKVLQKNLDSFEPVKNFPKSFAKLRPYFF